MNPISSYQPFLIGQGQQKTGLFTYLTSWIKPDDAYDTLTNAYVYRGVLSQRQGMILYPSAAGAGSLVYIDNKQIGVGPVAANGTYNSGSAGYVALNTVLPIVEGSVIVRTLTSSGVENFIDNGAGVLVGSLGDTGTIDYNNGDWSIILSGGRSIGAVNIYGDYGYIPQDNNFYNPIMGIKQFTSPTTGQSISVVMDTKRASYYDQNAQSFVGLNRFTQVIWEQFAAAATTGAITTQWINLTPFSVVIKAGADTTTDDGVGGIIASGNISGGTVVYATGVVTVTFTAPPAIGTQVRVTASVTGNYFTGTNANFFNATNWRFNDVEGDFLYMTNNVDPVTLFTIDQTTGVALLSRPLFNTILQAVKDFSYDSANHTTIQTTLDIKVYKNRLLFIRPTLLGTNGIPEAQTVRFSQQQTAEVNPSVVFSSYNFAADVPGNGGFVNAPTGDWLMATQLIRDVLVVFATNSTWNLRFTASSFDPYRFDQINSTRSTNAPYGSIPFDTNATSMGVKGLISCDTVNLDRYDEKIIDIFSIINQSGFDRCFGQKDDILNQAWMLFPGEANTLLTNDQALIFNYLEDTWAGYFPNMGNLIATPANINALSCLGIGRNTQDITWADFAPGGEFGAAGLNWSQANFPWIGNLTQTLSDILMGGDQNGFVYQMNTGVTDNGRAVQTFVKTKRFNPFVSQGAKARFGYLDIYYEKNPEITLSLNFYINNSLDSVKSTSINLDGPEEATSAWKRIYLSMVGEFLQIEITNQLPDGSDTYDTGGTFNILGMILYAMPGGRLTPGSFL